MADASLTYLQPTVAPGANADPSAPNLAHTDAETTGRTDVDGTPVFRQRVSAVPSGLTGRLLAKTPQSGYEVWLDAAVTTNLGAGVLLAEAPAGQSVLTATVWNGVFIPSAGGRWEERVAFAWSARTAGW